MKPRLSICMMVKNEEKYLERCLASLQSMRDAFPSELIIVDTGSEDATVEIAKRFTDKVYFHSWQNNFSDMRNVTIDYARGEWILIIDGDEVLCNPQPLIGFLQSPQRKQYGTVAFTTKNITDLDDPRAYTSLVGFRLFKHDGYFHYEGSVHNQPIFKGGALAMPEVYLLHYGYLSTDTELMERKFQRTGAILKQELEKDPDNIYYWNQLSVTYAMHNDYKEAVECVEKAYSLLPEKRTPNYMFVLLQLMLVYQHEGQYEKVADICREALAIKDGYLDVYYYYAEAQALLKNYSDAVIYYEKYLALLAQREVQDEKDVSIIEYTLGYEQIAYSNLLRLHKEQKEYQKAMACVDKLTYKEYVINNLPNIIYLHLVLRQYGALRAWYDRWVGEKAQSEGDFLFQMMQQLREIGDEQVKLGVAQAFRSIDREYGLLCDLIIEDNEGYISERTQQAVAAVKLDSLPVYCSGVLYYLLKWHHPLETIIRDYKEEWLTCVLEYVNKHYTGLAKVLYLYLAKYESASSIREYKLGKSLARCALLLGGLDDDAYRQTFDRYVRDGIGYLNLVYQPAVLAEIMTFEVKNDEEIFLLYMCSAQRYSKQQKEYVRFLRLALQAFPGMKRGVELLAKEVKSESSEKQQEFEGYKKQVKATISQLIESGKMSEAKDILDQYKTLVSNDLEAVLLESRILLN
ncbi:glycosyltransferase [Propionispora hippei]|uniref:Tetratricopeptide repeat-containing protein n=1 Tax=Propionispora hippei DSM 15287 TaxID=1123003 RepID=A0A1M6FGU3_9FIRM|nr:glycosyltransferase [Propionispora hippei]SHI96886.1 Tetratricopeptide repeat-containing protein [Propionispora hippei DSM 15287]